MEFIYKVKQLSVKPVLTSDKLGAALRGTVMGARTVKIEPTGSDTYQVELSISQTHIDRLLKSYRRGLL